MAKNVTTRRIISNRAYMPGLYPTQGDKSKINARFMFSMTKHKKILSHYLPYFESKNMCDPTLTPLIMTSSTYDVIETPENLFGLLI